MTFNSRGIYCVLTYWFCKIRVHYETNSCLTQDSLKVYFLVKENTFGRIFYVFYILCSWFFTCQRVVDVWHTILIGSGNDITRGVFSKSYWFQNLQCVTPQEYTHPTYHTFNMYCPRVWNKGRLDSGNHRSAIRTGPLDVCAAGILLP